MHLVWDPPGLCNGWGIPSSFSPPGDLLDPIKRQLKAARQAKAPKSYLQFQSPSTSSSKSQDAPLSLGTRPQQQPANQDLDLFSHCRSSLGICQSSISGRGIAAKRCFGRGTTILSISPHVRVLSTPHLPSYCSYCTAPATDNSGLKRCAVCRAVYYCDAKCQSADWRIHKRECKALLQWAKLSPNSSADSSLEVPSDAIRCLARIIWGRKFAGPESVWAREINFMYSYRTSTSPKQSEMQTHLAHALTSYLGVSSTEGLAALDIEGIRGLVDLISQFTTNSHTLTTPTLDTIGVAVAPLVALMNHTCVPNAVVIFPALHTAIQDVMHVVALQDIAVGQEILLSYIDTTLPRAARLAALQETYNFTCPCTLCTAPTQASEYDPREAIECRKRCGGACPLPLFAGGMLATTRCTLCGAVVEEGETIVDAVRVAQEALDKATRLQWAEPERVLVLATNALAVLCSQDVRMLATSHPRLALTRLIVSLRIAMRFRRMPSSNTSTAPSGAPPIATAAATTDADDANREIQTGLDETICLATTAAHALEALLAHGHPSRGVAWAVVGRLCAVDEPCPPPPITTMAPQRLRGVREGGAGYPPHGLERLELARTALLRASGELCVGFGSGGGDAGREARVLLVRLEREVEVFREGVEKAWREQRELGMQK